MDFRFPTMLYRFPAQGVDVHELQDENMRLWPFDTRTVSDDDGLSGAIASGWATTPAGARRAHFEAEAKRAAEAAALVAAGEKASDSTPNDNEPPSRAELEAKATELNIAFDRRMSDKTLAKKIGEALAAAEAAAQA